MSKAVYRDEFKIELIGGVLTAMSPRPNFIHMSAIRSIFRVLDSRLIDGGCEVFFDGLDVFLSPADRFIPDLIVVCDKSIIKNDGIHGAPDLVVEVLSPGTQRFDRGRKKDVYGLAGVKEYWIVDTNSFSIEVYLQDNGVMKLDNVYAICPTHYLEGLAREGKPMPPYIFSPSIFPNISIDIEEVFKGIVPENY